MTAAPLRGCDEITVRPAEVVVNPDAVIVELDLVIIDPADCVRVVVEESVINPNC